MPAVIKARNGPLSGSWRFRPALVSPVGRLVLRDTSWHLRRRGASRKARKVTWGRHSRPLFADYRSDQQFLQGLPPLRCAGSSLRGAKRAPCVFTETAIKRAIRGVRAAGETPGRLIVTREGFTVEFAAATNGNGGASRAGGSDAIATPGAADNLWDELLGVQQQ